MSRRMLATGVKVLTFSPMDPEHRQQPTEAQVRDALGRCTRELNDMVTARGSGWVVEDGSFDFNMIDGEGDLVLRGTLVIARPD